MEKNREGYQESVKKLMKMTAADPQSWPGVRGTLGELIQVDEKFELAIETALGAAVQNIVTDNDQTASRLIDYLKTNKAGRATFLPISQIRGRQADRAVHAQLSAMPGFLGTANELTRHEADIKEIVSSLLGRVLIVANLEQARAMAKACRYSIRLVTLEGDVKIGRASCREIV